MSAQHNRTFIGISIENKEMTPGAANTLAETAIKQFNSTQVLFLVADEIDIYNKVAFDETNTEKARKIIDDRGKEILTKIKAGTESFNQSSIKIETCLWSDITSPSYWEMYFQIFNFFIENLEFRNDIIDIAKKYAHHRKRTASKSKLAFLSQYLLAEIPVLIEGVSFNGIRYQNLVYPANKGQSLDFIVSKLINNEYDFCIDRKFYAIYIMWRFSVATEPHPGG